MKRTDNAGFSLVELIIVIAMTVILAGILIGAIGSISGYKVNEYAQITKSFLEKARTEAMAKNTVDGVCIYQKQEYYYIETYGEKQDEAGNIVYETVEVKPLGKALGIEIALTDKEQSEHIKMNNNTGDTINECIRIKFNAATGGIADIIAYPQETSKKDCIRLTIRKGEDSKCLEMNPVTGRISQN